MSEIPAGGLAAIANRGAPDVLSGIQVGAGIAQRQQQLNLQREQYQRGLEQLEIENRRKEEALKVAEGERAYNKSINVMRAGQKFGDVDMIKQGFKSAFSSAGIDIPEGFDIDQKTYDRFLKINDEKNPELREHMEDMFLEDIGTSIEAFEKKATRMGLPTDREARLKREAGEVEFGREKEMVTLKAEEDIRKEQARITGVTEAAQKAQTVEFDRINKILDDANIDEATKSKILITMQTGVGEAAERALFPTADAGRVDTIEVWNPESFQYDKVPVKYFTDPKTGKTVFEEIKRREPEVAARPAPTGVTRENLVNVLSGEKHVEGAPTITEYLNDIASDPANVDAAGNITVPGSDLLADYRQILKDQVKEKAQKKQETKKEGEKARQFLKKEIQGILKGRDISKTEKKAIATRLSDVVSKALSKGLGALTEEERKEFEKITKEENK
jgi:hypothetical protein